MADKGQTTGSPEAPAAPDTLGDRLRTARLASNLTLEQLSTELRIEAKHLAALEENRFEAIGVPVFVKGYLKQYALRLGLDPGDMLALYYKQTTLPEVQIRPSRAIKLRDERQIRSWVLAGVLLLAVVVVLAVWWLQGGNFAALPSLPGTRPLAPEEPPAAPQSSSVPPPAGRPSLEPPAAREGAPPAAPALEPDAGAAGAVENVPAPESTAESARGAGVAATIPLVFSFVGESWAEVTDARGERLLFGLNPAGRSVAVRGEPPFAVVLGNADAVELVVDGEPYEIPRTGRQGNLARFAVDIAEE